MNERRHSVFIGAFVVGALVIGVAATLFFTGAGFGGKRQPVVMAFDGSVKGLTIGAPVALRGVQVGQVTDIRLELSSDKANIAMLVEAEIGADNVKLVGKPLPPDDILQYLIDNGLRAQLAMQSVLTGMLYVQMDFHPGSAAKLAQIDSPHTQLPTIPTELELLRRTLQSIDYAEMADAVQAIAGSLRAVVEDEDFRALPADFRGTLGALERAGSRLDGSLRRLEPALGKVLSETGAAAASLNEAMPAMSRQLGEALASLNAALDDTRAAADAVGGRVAGDSPTVMQLQATLQEVARASRTLQSFLQLLEDQPDALLRGLREQSE